MNRTLAKALGLPCCLLLGGCAAGPDFKNPEPPKTSQYISEASNSTESTTNTQAGESQRFVNGANISAEWWRLFQSPALNGLIERAISNSPTLKAAQAALIQARENMLAQRGAYLPAVAGSFSANRQRTSSELSPTPNSGALYFNLFTPQVSVSYVPDVFGLNRRTVESLQAQAEQARFAMIASQLTLSANVAQAAIQEAAFRAQIAATSQIIQVNSNLLQVLRTQFAKGYVSRLDLATQESQLAQVQASLPPLRKQLAQQRDLLAALTGDFPAEYQGEPFELSQLRLPTELPISLPAQLVQQRPDVRQAEENLHAASAQIGIAVANRLPNITLTANVGAMALEAGKIFSNGAGFWTLAGTLSQPIFEGGTLRHREKAARAAYIVAAEQYQATVLTAFQNVADTLHALEEDTAALSAAAAAKNAAETTLNLASQQWQSGYSSYLSVLNAEQTYQQALSNLVQAEANRFTDTVALFQALGGGWWERPELASAPH